MKLNELKDQISSTKLLITLYEMGCDPTRVGNTHAKRKINRMLMKDEERNLEKLKAKLERMVTA